MPTIFIIDGILISMFGLNHNPPHIHVQSGEYVFSITLKDRIVKGYAPSSIIREVNNFMDSHIDELNDLWDKASKGLPIKKIKR